MEPIIERHLSFCEEYLRNGLNATQAYIKTYPDSSYDAAKSSAALLLTNPNIRKYIADKREESSKSLKISKEMLIQDLLDIKNANLGGKSSLAIRAIEVINRMQGYNEPEKSDITTNGDSINEININIIKPNNE